MQNADITKALARMGITLLVGYLATQLIRELGGGRLVAAGISGAAGSVAAVALLP